MSKKVLIISGSPRRGGNSDTLCDRFQQGALDAGNTAEKVFICDYTINYCLACGVCYGNKAPCVHKDDMTSIIEKMLVADVIVMSTPVYFYAMSGQLKTMIDRTIGRFMEFRNKEMYFILAAHSENMKSMERVLEGFRGYLACLPDPIEKGVLYGLGVFNEGDILKHTAMQEAYDMGKSI